MNSLVQTLNLLGPQAFQFAWSMLWQSSLLIALLFLLDLALRRRARAAVRYALWLVLLLPSLFPPVLPGGSFPTPLMLKQRTNDHPTSSTMDQPLRQFLPGKCLSLPLSMRRPNRVFQSQVGRLLPRYPSVPCSWSGCCSVGVRSCGAPEEPRPLLCS